MKLVPPVTYQGGKQRLAPLILDYIGLHTSKEGAVFYDLCCGSGAIAVELVNRGWNPANIVMVDSGPWGIVWQSIGLGTFDYQRLEYLTTLIPSDPRQIQGYLEELVRNTIQESDIPYTFLILQAGSWGGRAVSISGGKWVTPGFRAFWEPTATSSRRSHVNPMMPMPKTLLERVKALSIKMSGVRAFCVDLSITPWDLDNPGIVYVDPPYEGTTKYGQSVDVIRFSEASPFPTWVSEQRALGIRSIRLAEARKKGGISGTRGSSNEEWLTFFDKIGRSCQDSPNQLV